MTTNDMARPSRAETKARTRESLLGAAREVFGAVGYQGATLDDIAAKAGYTKGALYWHFPNKRAVFVALITDSIEGNLSLLDRLIEVEESGPEEIRKFLGAWIDGIDERETLPAYGVELEVEARNDPAFRAIQQNLIARHEDALAEFLARYFELVGEAPSMPVPALASIIITILKGFALVRQNRPDYPVGSAPVLRLLMNLPPQ